MKKYRLGFSTVSLFLIAAILFTGCAQKSDKEKNTSEKSEAAQTVTVQSETVKAEKSSETTFQTSTQAVSTTVKTTEPVSEKSLESSSVTSASEKQTSKTEKKNETEKSSGTTKKPKAETSSSATTKTTVPSTKPSTSKPAETAFFDDAVFVGDSVTLGLRNYVTSERNKGRTCLGKAQFLTAGSMGYTNTLPAIGTADSIHPKYKGAEVRIEDGVNKIGAKKVFIMLGMNDFCAYKLETGIANAENCIKKIVEKNPGIKIYIQSVTPTAKNSGRFNNTNIASFNSALKSLCRNNGWTYVDVASVMKDSNGNLKSEYCSDPEGRAVHMTPEGCKTWVNYLNETFA